MKPFNVEVSDDEVIPKECISSINTAIMEWSSTHISGALMLRPFLHWLDRVITMLVKDSLPEGSDSTTVAQVSSVENASTCEDVNVKDSSYVCEREEEVEVPEGERKSLSVLSPKKGTEVRLKDLVLGQCVGTVTFLNIKLVAECTRCKSSQDIVVTAEK